MVNILSMNGFINFHIQILAEIFEFKNKRKFMKISSSSELVNQVYEDTMIGAWILLQRFMNELRY